MTDNLSNDSQSEITLDLLRAVHDDQSLTQRSLARDLGVTLGLANTYLKRSVSKGLVKMSQVPNNRYAYYLTPKGFAEKSRLTAEFLSQSLSLFRQAQNDYSEILEYCVQRQWKRVILYGASDLADIFSLYARDYPIEIIGIVDANAEDPTFANLPVFKNRSQLGESDAYIITDLQNPQPVYDKLVSSLPYERVLSPKLLEISKAKLPLEKENQ